MSPPLPQTDPAVLALNLENRRQSSRLMLTPMHEIAVEMPPPPHMSAPALPPIRYAYESDLHEGNCPIYLGGIMVSKYRKKVMPSDQKGEADKMA